jgi:ribosomal protein S18 acetylase RimI-like enzyme
MVSIRNLQEKDTASCVTIANEAFHDEILRGMLAFNKEYFIKRMTTKNVKLVVAEKKKILGFMLITDANVFVPAQLHLIAVEKEDRGKGIGKQLIQYAIDYTIENNWEKLKLSTRPWNKAMRKICKNL